ncbi:Trypsin-like serine protease, partial [Halocaridina rubra]
MSTSHQFSPVFLVLYIILFPIGIHAQQKFPEDFYRRDEGPARFPTSTRPGRHAFSVGPGTDFGPIIYEDSSPITQAPDEYVRGTAALQADIDYKYLNNDSFSSNSPHGDRAIPQKCWYKSNEYDCGLSVSCVFQGAKPMDLCSGGMIWSCCVPRDRVDHVDDNLGALGNDV